MLADRSLLSSERLYPAADSDRYRHPQPNSGWSSYGRIGGRIAGYNPILRKLKNEGLCTFR